MPIIHVRIDDRLIHGQIAAAWARVLNVQRIGVVSNTAAANKPQQELLKMSAPPGVAVDVLSVNDAASKILANSYDRERVMLIVDSPKSLYELIRQGARISEANLGNLGGGKPGSRKLTKSTYLTEEDENILRELLNMGIKITVRMMPTDKEENLSALLKK